MKKIVITFTLIFICFSMISCNNEYVITDESLLSMNVDDMYKVYYEIFLGSFSDGNDDGMGDFEGLINRMDYLNDGDDDSGESLGVEGIWLMPIMPSPSYHKYDVTDYKNIDSEYGTLDDFRSFMELANDRGIDVIIDLVINHTSDLHPWFIACKQAIIDGDFDNKYIDYYSIVTESEKVSGRTYYQLYGDYYYEGNFSSSMPELNLDSEAVKEEIVDIMQFWYDLGVKGFRLDAVKYAYYGDETANYEFWDWFVTEAKNIKDDTYIVGEVWSGDVYIAPYYEYFSCFDFGMSQQQGATAVVANNMDDVNWYTRHIEIYKDRIETYNEDAILTPFISNHDMNRAAGYLNVEDYTMYSAASLYILSPGNPFIYYGEEIGMKGSRGTENTDANRRLAMLWGDGDTVEDPIGTTYDPDLQINGTVRSQLNDENSLYNHYKKLIMLRKANPEIARGEYQALDFDSYYTFGGSLSTYNGSTVGVFHNIGDYEITIDLSIYVDIDFSEVRGFAGMGTASLDGQILTLSPNTSVILK